jgi:hypothetical protein
MGKPTAKPIEAITDASEAVNDAIEAVETVGSILERVRIGKATLGFDVLVLEDLQRKLYFLTRDVLNNAIALNTAIREAKTAARIAEIQKADKLL